MVRQSKEEKASRRKWLRNVQSFRDEYAALCRRCGLYVTIDEVECPTLSSMWQDGPDQGAVLTHLQELQGAPLDSSEKG